MKKKAPFNLRRPFAKQPFRGSLNCVSASTSIGAVAYCLFSRVYGRLYAEELEAARKTVRRAVRRDGGILRMRVYPTRTFTKKPLQARMGKGKGRIQGTFAFVRPGQLLFELCNIVPSKALLALGSGAAKLSLRTVSAPFGSVFL